MLQEGKRCFSSSRFLIYLPRNDNEFAKSDVNSRKKNIIFSSTMRKMDYGMLISLTGLSTTIIC